MIPTASIRTTCLLIQFFVFDSTWCTAAVLLLVSLCFVWFGLIFLFQKLLEPAYRCSNIRYTLRANDNWIPVKATPFVPGNQWTSPRNVTGPLAPYSSHQFTVMIRRIEIYFIWAVSLFSSWKGASCLRQNQGQFDLIFFPKKIMDKEGSLRMFSTQRMSPHLLV